MPARSGGPVAPLGHGDHPCPLGGRDLRRAVGAAVVGHDHLAVDAEAGHGGLGLGDAARQRLRLVEAGEDHRELTVGCLRLVPHLVRALGRPGSGPGRDPSPIAAGDPSVAGLASAYGSCEHVFVCGRGHDPARRPRRLLRVGRAARRSPPAGPAGDRRRRRRAGGQLRGQGVRRAHGHGRRPGPAAVPAGGRRRRPGWRPTRRPAGRCSRSSRTPRRWSRGCRSTRRSSTSAACAGCRARPVEIAAAPAPARGRAGGPAHHGGGGPHQVPGQGGQRRGQARRAAGRAARRRAGVPAPAAGRAAVGRGPGHGGEAARPRASPRSATWPALPEGCPGGHARAGRRGATCTPWPTTATPGRWRWGGGGARSAPSGRSGRPPHARSRHRRRGRRPGRPGHPAHAQRPTGWGAR